MDCRSYRSSEDEDDCILRSPCPGIPIPDKTFGQLIWEKHGQWTDRTALVNGETGASYTYGQLFVKSQNIGRFLRNQGLLEDDVLAICLPNSPEYVALILAACQYGLTITNMNPLYTEDEIATQLKDSGAKSIVTFPHKLSVIRRAVEDISEMVTPDFRIILLKGSTDELPSVDRIVILEEVLSEPDDEGFPQKYCETNLDKKLALILYSSGTSGLPKGVCLSHRTVAASITQMSVKDRTMFKEATDSFQDVIPLVLPIFHIFGLEVVLCSLYHGSQVVTLSTFQETSFLKALKDNKSSLLVAVPPMVQFLAKRESVTEEHLRHLRCIVVGGAPIGEEDIRSFREKAPSTLKFLQVYGQTEAVGCLTLTPYDSDNSSSVGQPIPNTELIVVDVESGKRLPANQNGEICFRGPLMTVGYLNNEKANAEVIDPDGWFHTGDVGYYDEQGYLYIIDRIKDLIKVKGFQVAPAELEAILSSHPQVEEVGVISVPHEKKGESPIGFVKLKPGASATEYDLRKYLSTKVAPYKTIDKYYFVDSIPKTSSGKILRRKLKELYK